MNGELSDGVVTPTVTKEFKLAAVRRLEQAVSIAEVARGLEVSPNMLRRWKKEFRAGTGNAFPGNGKQRWSEGKVAELERKISQQTLEIDFLKGCLQRIEEQQMQHQKIGVDGYSAFFLMSQLLHHPDTFLPFPGLSPAQPSELSDQVFVSLFVISFASYLLLRLPEILTPDNVYRFTHPLAATRMNFLMREITARCSHDHPALEEWLWPNGWPLVNVSAVAMLGIDGSKSWDKQLEFFKSEEGKNIQKLLRTA